MQNIELCFFHIEKCIGSSLRNILYNYLKHIYKDTDIFLPSHKNGERNLTAKTDVLFFKDQLYKVVLCHCSFDHLNVTDDFSKSCFSITCIRHPINRLISHYYYFDYSSTKLKIHELSNDILKQLIINYGRVMLMRLSGHTLDVNIAKYNISNNINCIMIFENFENDLKSLNNLLNTKYNVNIAMENVKINENKINYSEWVDNDIAKINEHLHLIEDIELYNYAINLDKDVRFKL